MWRRKGGGLYLKLYRAGLPEYEEEVFDQQDQNPGQVEGSSLMILLPDRPQLTEILIQDQSQDFRQFNQNYLVQLDLHSSIRSTQFNQIYLVQLDLPSSTRYTKFNQIYLVQLDIPSSIRSTQFNNIYLVQLDIPSSIRSTQFNQIYLV